MSSQGKVKLQVWLLIAVVFALGAVTGGSLDRVYVAKRSALSNENPNRPRRAHEMESPTMRGCLR